MDHAVKTVEAFCEWEKRNSVEKRRADQVDYENDPVPGRGLFTLSARAKEQLLQLGKKERE